MKKEKLVEKIDKLLKLSESPNENEAKAAMAMAQKLLVKHKLQMQDIREAGKGSIRVIEINTGIVYSRRRGYWKPALMKVIAENNCVGAYALTRYRAKTRTIGLVGTEEDIEFCMKLFEYAGVYVTGYMKRLKKEYGDLYTSAQLTAIENSYGVGFSKGVKEALERQKKDNEAEWGIVMVMPAEADNFMKKLAEDRSTAEVNLSDEEIHKLKGYEDGTAVTFNDKLEKCS